MAQSTTQTETQRMISLWFYPAFRLQAVLSFTAWIFKRKQRARARESRLLRGFSSYLSPRVENLCIRQATFSRFNFSRVSFTRLPLSGKIGCSKSIQYFFYDYQPYEATLVRLSILHTFSHRFLPVIYLDKFYIIYFIVAFYGGNITFLPLM